MAEGCKKLCRMHVNVTCGGQEGPGQEAQDSSLGYTITVTLREKA